MIAPATSQLLDLALAVRADWDRDELTRAVANAQGAGIGWPRLLTETVRLMTRADGSPRDLANLAANPMTRRDFDPEVHRNGITALREALDGRPS